MRFIKQLSEDEFIVKMGPEDCNNVRSITLTHDYLQFNGRDWYCTDLRLKDTPWSYANVINVRTHIQIPIRMAQDILENVLTKDREYLKKEYLIRFDGTPGYCDGEGHMYKYTKDDGTKMIAIYNTDTNEYYHMHLSIYNSISIKLE